MYLLFEEGGDIKAASILAQQGEAWQAELPGGKRTKIKAKDVWLAFKQPAPATLLTQAQSLAERVDVDFLWECVPEVEFGFSEQAVEYFGLSDDAAQQVVHQVALALALQNSPIYFRRKGRGRYLRAPQEQIQAAKAGLERKQQQALQQAAYVEALKAHQLPEAFQNKVLNLLFKPDKNSVEWKALDAACTALGVTPMRLILDCGGIASPQALHEAKFMVEHFPKGTAFPDIAVPQARGDLPLADVQAFSIDDTSTTEIDDAFSIHALSPEQWRIGIHIAAPGLGMQRGDACDAIARQRLSTVYFPGDKITMLPPSVIDAYTLEAGRTCPALSLYLTVNAQTWAVEASETRAERITVAANLRHNLLDAEVTEVNLGAGTGDYPYKAEFAVLWPFVQALHAQRQVVRAQYGLRPETQSRTDYNFYVERDAHGAETVRIAPRPRGAPLDMIVAELMILANSTWGQLLGEAGVPGIYRAQRSWRSGAGRGGTRMLTHPAPHEGLGVAQYAWSTSPLRRYVDMVNQWQILAVVQHGVMAKMVAPFKPKDADLYATVADFEATYATYAQHQDVMERYWCLRWLAQEQRGKVSGLVLKDGAVRLDEIPLLLHVPELQQTVRGTAVVLEVLRLDYIALEVTCRVVEVLAQALDAEALAAEDAAEMEAAVETAVEVEMMAAPDTEEAALAMPPADALPGENRDERAPETEPSLAKPPGIA